MRLSRALLCTVAFSLLLAPLPAQLDEWHTQPVVAPSSIKLEQNLCVVADGPAVHAFSAVTRQWTTMVASWSQQPVLNIRNEHCLVQDGPVFWGFAPRLGVFTPLYTFSGTPSLAPITSPQTWHDIVVDGNSIHTFLSVTGYWLSYTFAAAPIITNGRFAFAVEAQGEVYGISSFHGSLVPLGVSGASVIGAYGNMLFASSPGFVHAFSTSRNRWVSLPVYGTPAILTGNSQPICAAIDDGIQIAFFSGNTGTFTVIPAVSGSPITIQRGVAVVLEGPIAHAYSGLTGQTDTAVGGSAPQILVEQYQAFVENGASTSCFSATRGAFTAAWPVPLTQITASAQVAVASDASGQLQAVYSSYLDLWHAIPGGFESATPHLTATSVILEKPGLGLMGVSMRNPTWKFQPTGALNWAQAGASPPQLAETFVAEGGNTLYAFNPLHSSWHSVATAAPAVLRRAHHHVILCGDGQNAYAFGNWTDRWAVQPVSVLPISGNSNTQVQAAYVLDGNSLHAYSGVGQLSLTPEYPHYYRAATLGSLFRLDLAAAPHATFVLGISTTGAEIPLDGNNVLRLDPGTLAVLAQASIPASGSTAFVMPIPDEPALRGLELHFQAACSCPVNGLYLTNDVIATIL